MSTAASRWSRAARSAPRSELRGLLQAFQPLLLSWSGQQELKTLLRAEWRGGLPRVGGRALLCGFYLNELLLKLLPREDPHADLFGDYEAALAELAAGARSGRRAAPVRSAAAGRDWATRCRSCATPTRARRSIPPHATITRSTAGRAANRRWRGRGCRSCAAATLIALSEQRYPDAATAAEAKRLMREVLDHYLEQRGVESRRVVQDLQALEDETGTPDD